MVMYGQAITHRASTVSTQELSSQEKLEAEQRLWDLGYWAGPVDGKFDSDSRHALIAFQKVEAPARTGKLTLNELNALRDASRPIPRHRRYAHVEIDLGRQTTTASTLKLHSLTIAPAITAGVALIHNECHKAKNFTLALLRPSDI